MKQPIYFVVSGSGFKVVSSKGKRSPARNLKAKNAKQVSLAAFIDMELMDRQLAENCRDLTAVDIRALAAKFARWSRECRKEAAAMVAASPVWCSSVACGLN
jgi:hypothetical protein